MYELIQKLTSSFGPSGNEEVVRDVIIKEIKDYADEINVDTLGNLIAVKKGNGSGKKIMLAAHMDEVGVIVTFIDKNGFLRFSNIGYISQYSSLFQKVVFKNGTIGTVGFEEKLEEMKDLKLSKMYIDIGAKDKNEAQKLVNIGDTASFMSSFNISNNCIITKALDDRIGCYILIELLKKIGKYKNDLYFVFTVQEELGLRGAKTSSYKLDPDYAISVDVTATGDKPESKDMSVSLGKGPAVKIKDTYLIAHPYVRDIMIETAKEENLPYQLEVLEHGGTDSGAIHISKGGIPSGVLSIPTRYIHSPNEIVDINDVNSAISMLEKIIQRDFK